MDRLKQIVTKKVLLHFIFWVLMMIIVFTSENWENGGGIQWHMIGQFSIAFVVFAATSYFNIYFLLPRYFKTKQYYRYSLFLLLALVGGSIFLSVVKDISEHIGYSAPQNWQHQGPSFSNFFFHVLFGCTMFVLLTSFFYIFEEWIRMQGITIKLQHIEQQKVHAELQALKAQINPHFLFNTLNNIYSHSLEKSPQTPQMILKLSSLMSYILYDCHEKYVPLTNELEFIRNYIELEKLRFEDFIDVQLYIDEQYTTSKIIPLLLIPFIENAFKHGGSKGSNKRYVCVTIVVHKSYIQCVVKNSIGETNFASTICKESGIGIENVKKRLDLLYANQHTLHIHKNEHEFCIDLIITQNGN